MKAYTDLEQSKKLAKILPIESADMYYQAYYDSKNNLRYIPRFSSTFVPFKIDIPAWNLATLLSVLPKGTNISTPKPTNELSYCCWNQYDEIYASNPVDACYEMIMKLHELKKL